MISEVAERTNDANLREKVERNREREPLKMNVNLAERNPVKFVEQVMAYHNN